MSDLINRSSRCSYCGASLDSSLYFCVKCGKPYADCITVAARNVPQFTPYAIRHDRIRKTLNFYWIFFGTILLVGALNTYFDFGPNNIGILFITYSFLLLFSIVFIRANNITISSFFVWKQKNMLILLIALLALVPLLVLNFAYHGLIIYLLDNFGASSDYQTAYSGLFDSFLLNILLICLLPGFFEEFIFRGIIQSNMELVADSRTAVFITAGLFSIVHFSVISFPYLFLLGVFLGLLKIKTGSLWIPVIIHCVHNFAVIILS